MEQTERHIDEGTSMSMYTYMAEFHKLLAGLTCIQANRCVSKKTPSPTKRCLHPRALRSVDVFAFLHAVGIRYPTHA